MLGKGILVLVDMLADGALELEGGVLVAYVALDALDRFEDIAAHGAEVAAAGRRHDLVAEEGLDLEDKTLCNRQKGLLL